MPGSKDLGDASDYLLDACQRSILFLDVLRQRGNNFRERQKSSAPHVLTFDTELIADGRTFERPTNYLLVKIAPDDEAPTDSAKSPFVVVDPRAGHGPGIGGMKQDSEIGVALENGHPCYFVGFLPEPLPGQTIEDVWNTEAIFVEEVARRHPDAGKPVVIGNCQAGWQSAIMAATHPDAPGPLMLAGSAAFLLGRRTRQKSAPLPRRDAGRHLADESRRRSWWRKVRRSEFGRQFRIDEPRQHLFREALRRLFEGRHRGPALSRFRDLVGKPGADERRRDAVGLPTICSSATS